MKVSREYILQAVKQTLHLVAPNAKIGIVAKYFESLQLIDC